MRRQELPAKGLVWKEIEDEMTRLRSQDRPWARGIFVANWPEPPRNVQLVARAASQIFYNSMISGRRMQPSVEAMYSQLCDFTMSLLNAPESARCILTSGGTESNILAVKAARAWTRASRSIDGRPQILMPFTGHPSFDKAADLMDLEVVRVPEGADLRADVDAMAKAITPRTFMIIASAPPWPHGRIDPVPQLANLARERNLWLHVDASIGGFLTPFLRQLGRDIIPCDFSVAGVRSITSDPHKYGYAPTGVGALVFDDAAGLDHMRFKTQFWSFGQYGVDEQILGAKSASSVAAAWAVLVHLGKEGLLEATRALLRVGERMTAGIQRIPGLTVQGGIEAGALVILSKEKEIDILQVAKAMSSRGFMTAPCRVPPAIHLMMNPVEDERHLDGYLEALAASVEDVRRGVKISGQFDAY